MDWTDARVAHGAFHDVVLTRRVAARLADGHGHEARTNREVAIWRQWDSAEIGIATPRLASAIETDTARTGVLTDTMAGDRREGEPWTTSLGDELLGLRDRVRATDTSGWDLPAPRSWCGGPHWPDIVTTQLLPQLPAACRATAALAVTRVLAAEQGAPAVLLHGDFGPHNILWNGSKPLALLDLDHSCVGDPSIDVAPLVGFYGVTALEPYICSTELERAVLHRASLSLQVASAAYLVGDHDLQAHALRNFASRNKPG